MANLRPTRNYITYDRFGRAWINRLGDMTSLPPTRNHIAYDHFGRAWTIPNHHHHPIPIQGRGIGANIAPNNAPQVPVHGLWTYGNYCGTGGMGTPINAMDAGCAAHDACYAQHGLSAGGNILGSNPALQGCNQSLCNVAESVLKAQNRVGGDLDQASAAFDINSYFHGFANIIRSGNRCR